MADDSATRTIRLIVSGDGNLRVREKPEGLTMTLTPVPLDLARGLQEDTIRLLVDMARCNRLDSDHEYQLLGSHLYAVLFGNDIGRALHEALADMSIKRMRVVLEFEEDQHELAAWPWEYLYCPLKLGATGSGYFLHQLTRLVLIRNLPLDSSQGVTVEAPPVRVLFLASEPRNMHLSYESVLERVEDLADATDGEMELRVIRPTARDADSDSNIELAAATYRNFVNTVETWEPHMIHIVAHGRRVGESSEIAFMDANRDAKWISEEELASDLSSVQIRAPRFVMLEACESALPGYDTLRNHHAAVSGVAMRLAHAGIPAVVGMQYEIEQGDANAFTNEFYTALIDRETVDMAVLRGRRALLDAERDRPHEDGEGNGRSKRRPGFGLPVLYLSNTGALFPPPGSETANLGDVGGTGAARLLQTAEPDAPMLERCPRCAHPCDWRDKYCDRCHNYLKCPRCQYPVAKARESCGQCESPLEREGVDLNPRQGIRRVPPAAQAGKFV